MQKIQQFDKCWCIFYLSISTAGDREAPFIQLFDTCLKIKDLRGSFIKFPDWGCNFSKNWVILLKLFNNLYIYISDSCFKFHLFNYYSFIFVEINVNASIALRSTLKSFTWHFIVFKDNHWVFVELRFKRNFSNV